jgi:thiamine kinase-like enzyme
MMKLDSPDIDKQALRRLLEDQYGLRAATLSFVPGGEEIYGYLLETAARSCYFCRVYEHPSELDVRYKAANRLHTRCGLGFVVHPHETRHGTFHAPLGEFSVAVYDWIDGTACDQSGFSDQEWQQVARLTAALHQSVGCPALPLERFELWFEDWLSSVLRATQDTGPLDIPCAREARALLARAKSDILTTLNRLKQLAACARTRAATFERVPTHGDLNPGDFIKDSEGCLHVVDWSKITLAPPERDLVAFNGERFELFLESYLSGYEAPPRLHPELFEYYNYFLILWGIADYGSWILLEDAGPVEQEHAWTELQQYLPMNHEHVQADRVRQAIQRAIGGQERTRTASSQYLGELPSLSKA